MGGFRASFVQVVSTVLPSGFASDLLIQKNLFVPVHLWCLPCIIAVHINKFSHASGWGGEELLFLKDDVLSPVLPVLAVQVSRRQHCLSAADFWAGSASQSVHFKIHILKLLCNFEVKTRISEKGSTATLNAVKYACVQFNSDMKYMDILCLVCIRIVFSVPQDGVSGLQTTFT